MSGESKSKAKLTPGPWKTSREDMDSYATNESGKMEHVVYVYRGDRGDQPRIPIFAGKLNNARADARLIAASRELLVALKAIVALDDGDKPDLWHFEAEFAQARAAIAKAEVQP